MTLKLEALGQFFDFLAQTDSGLGSVQPCLRGAAQVTSASNFGGSSVNNPVRPVNDECFQLIDQRSGKPVPNAHYRIDWPSGVTEGTSDENGYTQRIGTGYRVEDLKVTYFPPEQIVPDENSLEEGCR